MLTGSLTHRFFGVRKVDPPKRALRNSISRFGDPFFERKKVTFLKKSAKSDHGVLPGGKGAKSQSFRSCVFLRRPIRRMDEAPFSTDSKSGKGPISSISKKFKLRAPAVHGVSSNFIIICIGSMPW